MNERTARRRPNRTGPRCERTLGPGPRSKTSSTWSAHLVRLVPLVPWSAVVRGGPRTGPPPDAGKDSTS